MKVIITHHILIGCVLDGEEHAPIKSSLSIERTVMDISGLRLFLIRAPAADH